MALHQAQRVRDSRGAPEFVFDPRKGESYKEALDIKGNPSLDLDWYETKSKATGETCAIPWRTGAPRKRASGIT